MNTAIVLAGGKGTRMGSDIPKQYMLIDGKPLLYYSIKTFSDNENIDRVIVVASDDYIDYIHKEIKEKYEFTKITDIVTGGKERYDSVYQGLKLLSDEGYVFIHDGARPCITNAVIDACFEEVVKSEACVAAVPVKDTIKVSDSNGNAINTPDRKTLWQVQTPQVFSNKVIKAAYQKMYMDNDKTGITDDAMVVENYNNIPVKLVMSDYKNIKVTTPEDINIVSVFIKNI